MIDYVNHPPHYTAGKYETIDIIEDVLGVEGLRGMCIGNALKYLTRAGKKYPDKEIEDLKKAVWYINKIIEVMENTKKMEENNDRNN